MEITQSARSRSVISPHSSAFWWPRLREIRMPEKTGSCACRSEMICHVSSFEPSSIMQMRLSGPIVPAVRRAVNFSRRRRAVSGSTAASL